MVSLVSQPISGRQKLAFSDLAGLGGKAGLGGRAGLGTVGGWFAHLSAGILDLGWPISLVPPQLLSDAEGLPAPRDWATSSPHAWGGSDLVCRKGFSLMGTGRGCPRRWRAPLPGRQGSRGWAPLGYEPGEFSSPWKHLSR